MASLLTLKRDSRSSWDRRRLRVRVARLKTMRGLCSCNGDRGIPSGREVAFRKRPLRALPSQAADREPKTSCRVLTRGGRMWPCCLQKALASIGRAIYPRIGVAPHKQTYTNALFGITVVVQALSAVLCLRNPERV